jgi:hypothetical protein
MASSASVNGIIDAGNHPRFKLAGLLPSCIGNWQCFGSLKAKVPWKHCTYSSYSSTALAHYQQPRQQRLYNGDGFDAGAKIIIYSASECSKRKISHGSRSPIFNCSTVAQILLVDTHSTTANLHLQCISHLSI